MSNTAHDSGAHRVSIAPVTHPDMKALPPAILNFYSLNLQASTKYEEALPVRKEWLRGHYFQPAANLCIDGRVQDAGPALGLPIGILEPYRSAGAVSDLERDFYRLRRSAKLRRLKSVQVSHDAPATQMGEMAMFTVHYSHSQPDTASCAAWGHDTARATKNALRLADQYNNTYRGQPVVGFAARIDTDLDAITVMGPGGELSVRDLIEDPRLRNGRTQAVLMKRLYQCFPMDWEPIKRLTPEFRENFHIELTERLIANMAFVRQVQDNGRAIELLDHQERLVFVGRHCDWIEDHNSVFLIDDTEEEADVIKSFLIGLQYVLMNVVKDAIQNDTQEWHVPVIINVPHDEEEDFYEAVFGARKVLRYLKKALADHRAAIFEKVFRSPHGLDPKEVPDWLFRQAYDYADRVVFAASASYRKDRRFRPIE